MLRRLHNPESELLELCKSGSWESVASRTRTHPAEATVTEAARNGTGTTALSIALRSNASLSLLQEILEADVSQIAVKHFIRGTILHESFRHQVDDDILEFLVEQAIRYENDTLKSGFDFEKTEINGLFEIKDELGRTPLHHMIHRIANSFDHGVGNNHRTILQKMIDICPQAIATIDADGTTPLIMLLVSFRFETDPMGQRCEKEIYYMATLMLKACPEAVKVVRRLPRSWHFHHTPRFNSMQHKLLHGEGTPTPLSCAILHCRSLETIQLLLSVSRQMGTNACTTLVTHHEETALHIAATMNSSLEIIQALVDEAPAVAGLTDAKGLTPLDWMWIRHVTDWCSYTTANHLVHNMSVSRRRYISTQFLQWHEHVSSRYLNVSGLNGVTTSNPAMIASANRLRTDMIQRASKVLPSMLRLRLQDGHQQSYCEDQMNIPLIHSACATSCPLGLIALFCESFPEQLHLRESETGRLPLHIAASRSGYLKEIPNGPTAVLDGSYVTEDSSVQWILSKNPSACQISDNSKQLPLHIAIDLVKRARNAQASGEGQASGPQDLNTDCMKEITVLLDQYPAALHRRDGLSKLYPFQQAAEGTNGDVELAFILLRRDPTLLQSGATGQ